MQFIEYSDESPPSKKSASKEASKLSVNSLRRRLIYDSNTQDEGNRQSLGMYEMRPKFIKKPTSLSKNPSNLIDKNDGSWSLLSRIVNHSPDSLQLGPKNDDNFKSPVEGPKLRENFGGPGAKERSRMNLYKFTGFKLSKIDREEDGLRQFLKKETDHFRIKVMKGNRPEPGEKGTRKAKESKGEGSGGQSTPSWLQWSAEKKKSPLHMFRWSRPGSSRGTFKSRPEESSGTNNWPAYLKLPSSKESLLKEVSRFSPEHNRPSNQAWGLSQAKKPKI